jgi:hypothetical protein
VISIDDAVAFQAAVILIAPLTISNRWQGAFDMVPTGRYDKPFESWYEQWPEYQRKIRDNIASGFVCLGVTDISSYFEYIDHGLLSEKLRAVPGLSRDLAAFVLYLLERWVYRPTYAANRLCGIPQLDHDGPRFLANFFLFDHDHRVGSVCPEYVRWMDDMNLPARSPAEVRIALKEVDQSLRDHYLSINRGKTTVLTSPGEIEEYFWFEFNDFLDRFDRVAPRKRVTRASHRRLERLLARAFDDFRSDWKQRKGGHGEKILRRFLTMFKRLDSRIPLPYIGQWLVDLPGLEDKLFQYLLNITWNSTIIDKLDAYLLSKDNIYESLEISCLRLLLLHRIPQGPDRKKALAIGERYFYGKGGTTPLSWYATILGAYLIGKYGSRSDLRKALKHAGKTYDRFHAPLARRHLAYLSLAIAPSERSIAEFREKSMRDPERLVQMVWQLEAAITDPGTARVPEPVMRKLSLRKIAYPTVTYFPWSRVPLLELLSRQDNLHPQLRGRVSKLRAKNQDPVVAEVLSAVERAVA